MYLQNRRNASGVSADMSGHAAQTRDNVHSQPTLPPRSRGPLRRLYLLIGVLVVVNIALWVAYGRNAAAGGFDAGIKIMLFLVPALTFLLFIGVMRRRAAAHAAMAAQLQPAHEQRGGYAGPHAHRPPPTVARFIVHDRRGHPVGSGRVPLAAIV